jgi:hypothetical protein
MHPVQHFKANFSHDEITDTTSDNPACYTVGSMELHETDSSTRNLCLVWEDGRRAFFNYAYLVACDLTVQDSINVLLLSFGTYTVIVKGYNLLLMFNALLEHSPKTISAVNPRYVTQNNFQDSSVIEITIKLE